MFRVVIPARLASVRLPGKVLRPIGGRPMLQWVYERAANAGAQQVLVCNDARMREVYWACFSRSADDPAIPVGSERVSEPAEVALPADWPARAGILGAGTGFAAYPQLADLIPGGAASIHVLYPRAAEIALLAVAEVAAGRVFDPGLALPVYLRDNVVQVPTANH